MNPRLSPGDYAPFFDDEMLDKMMKEWFAPAEEAPAAWTAQKNFPDEKEGKFFSFADVILSDACFV